MFQFELVEQSCAGVLVLQLVCKLVENGSLVWSNDLWHAFCFCGNRFATRGFGKNPNLREKFANVCVVCGQKLSL